MILPILTGDQPDLRKKAQPIKGITPDIQKLAADMIETMHHNEGVGLAGPQIGKSLQIFVAQGPSPQETTNPAMTFPLYVVINPKISILTDQTATAEEGCLSLPSYFGEVERPTHIKVQALDIKGTVQKFELHDFAARVFLHENDHLQGILFTDYIKDPTQLSFRPPSPKNT